MISVSMLVTISSRLAAILPFASVTESLTSFIMSTRVTIVSVILVSVSLSSPFGELKKPYSFNLASIPPIASIVTPKSSIMSVRFETMSAS